MMTINCKVVAMSENLYSHIVVEDLDRDYCDDLKYVTVVLLPNWFGTKPKIGDEGFLQFEPVEAGKTQWFNKEKTEAEFYKYTANYFINFVPKVKDVIMKEYKF